MKSWKRSGTEEAQVISTISIAVTSIVIIIFIGVLLLTPLQPILGSEILEPAFENILPLLFGALAVVFVSKNWKIAMAYQGFYIKRVIYRLVERRI